MWARVPVAAFVLLTGALVDASEKEYAGAKTCGTCHPELFARQSGSGHAHALHPGREHPLAERFAPPIALLRRANFRFRFSFVLSGLQVSISDGKASQTIPVQWAFGAGEQAVTFVSQLDEDTYLECHFSYYATTRSLLPTPGHSSAQAVNLADASGVMYPTFDPESRIMRCFQCHSTGPLSLGPKFEIQPAELGVRCESCHGPGRRHVKAAQHGDRAADLIQNPRRLSAVALNNFCGTCHRQPAPVGGATNWTEPWNVRHQPLYLDQSTCFQKSRGRLSCLTCHDPHGPLVKNASYYNGRCSGCHESKRHPRIAQMRGDDCIGCHMPRVAPQAHLAFTNHWIGIYRPGSVLRPVQ